MTRAKKQWMAVRSTTAVRPLRVPALRVAACGAGVTIRLARLPAQWSLVVFCTALILLVPVHSPVASAQSGAVRSAANRTDPQLVSAPHATNLRLRTATGDRSRPVPTIPAVPPTAFPAAAVPPALNAAERAAVEPPLERLPAPDPVQQSSPSDREPAFRERPLYELSTDIQPPAGQLPADAMEPRFQSSPVPGYDTFATRNWERGVYCWEAPLACSYPLYFEDINLERHGHHVPYAQPVFSAAHFFCRVPALPYLMALEFGRPHPYTLGHGRPGTREPCPIRQLPVAATPAAVQAAIVLALIFALP